MNTFLAFLKDIFTLNDDDNMKVGLSQFKKPTPKKVAKPKVTQRPEDIKLSDLMKRSY